MFVLSVPKRTELLHFFWIGLETQNTFLETDFHRLYYVQSEIDNPLSQKETPAVPEAVVSPI